ncbi:MAG: hypothetical protein HC804_04100 [Anaerolineae bacterium]|nr:hypothetical protein [Anaerolineae bacterium]
MTICLIVTSIIGVFCQNNATPIGDCMTFPAPFSMTVCTVAAEQLPVRASWYNPTLGGVNCMEPCAYLGDGTAVQAAYGWAIACPDGWYGRWLTIEHAGRWQCRDHGGAIQPTYGRTFTANGFVECWWLPVDFLTHDAPPYAYMLLEWKG